MEAKNQNIGKYNHLALARDIYNLKIDNVKKITAQGKKEVSCKGVALRIDLNIPITEISIAISSPIKILEMKRLNKKIINKDETGKTTINYVPSETLLIMFEGTNLPISINIFGLPIKINPYILSVTQCFKCLLYGNTQKNCKDKENPNNQITPLQYYPHQQRKKRGNSTNDSSFHSCIISPNNRSPPISPILTILSKPSSPRVGHPNTPSSDQLSSPNSDQLSSPNNDQPRSQNINNFYEFEKIYNSQNTLTQQSTNISSLNSNKHNLINLVRDNEPDIIILNETWLKPNFKFSFTGFHTIRSDRTDGQKSSCDQRPLQYQLNSSWMRIPDCGFSDHYPTFISIFFNNSKIIQNETIARRKFRKTDWHRFSKELECEISSIPEKTIRKFSNNHSNFKSRLPSNEIAPKILEKLNKIDINPNHQLVTNDIQAPPITVEEIKFSIKYKKDSATGMDEISYSILNNLPKKWTSGGIT
ncbi:unnamed protein product [Brassicogethes aeneus]|uniref:Endonuclease/exonuclease/phosphatase domain-containing protein n=1 Tax=Brassicogethes aeneus TaxID=1431903 RepID=A0A9P0B763_BRAAE|nr:unnamed protein product [Brassicogethes aeneus]